jgi:hypothetical protein
VSAATIIGLISALLSTVKLVAEYAVSSFTMQCRSGCRPVRQVRAGGSSAAPSNRPRAGADGLVPPLVAKAAEIVAACGSQIISGVRHT